MQGIIDRPLRVTILSVFVLSITAWNILRIYSAIEIWDILREFGASPAYIMGSGLFWVIASLGLAYAILIGKRIAFGAGLALAVLYFAWYWLDRLVLQPNPAPNIVFSAVVSTILLALVLVNFLASKAFFDKYPD